jgi:hypothetical protein
MPTLTIITVVFIALVAIASFHYKKIKFGEALILLILAILLLEISKLVDYFTKAGFRLVEIPKDIWCYWDLILPF